MRIVAGRHRGLRLNTPEKGAPTRPTTDRAREALFSAIGPRIVGADFLDLFSGTGANALEALSRGARRVVLVERHPKALRCIRKNLALLGDPPEAELVGLPVERFLAGDPPGFDLAFADPPFKLAPQKVLALFEGRGVIRPGGTLYIEYRRDRHEKNPPPPEAPAGFTTGRSYRHGEAGLTAYHRDEPA